MSSLLDASPLKRAWTYCEASEPVALWPTPARRGAASRLGRRDLRATWSPSLRDAPLVVRASSLRDSSSRGDIRASSLARVRGVLINQVLRLLSVGVDIEDAFGDSLLAWRAEVGSNELTRPSSINSTTTSARAWRPTSPRTA